MAKGRVMFVDDEEALARPAGLLLERMGFDAHVTTDPLVALAEIEADRRYAALVTDLNMPGMSGIELAARVRALRPSMSIALCGGTLGPGPSDAARAAGIDRVVAKPYTGEELGRVVEALLALSRSRDPG